MGPSRPDEMGLVWYVAYGSNLSRSRFREYLDGCADTADPRESRALVLPHRLWFGGSSRRWGGGGVAFLDADPNAAAPSPTFCRAWLITADQFAEVQAAEGAWYARLLDLGEDEGVPVRSFTYPVDRRPEPRRPSASYLDVIAAGLAEAHGMSREDALAHLAPLTRG